ncbi:MAG: cysteine desulfurase NifS [Planctomycetota bacterium]|nr:MAG: cysteine desulfurase NifS [Planctomycetota bacterium]
MEELIYLDHAATTPVHPRVREAMMPYISDYYGNPETLYSAGVTASEAVEDARGKVAALINCDPSEIYFTSGGTESDNWAIKGTAFARRDKGRHIITSSIEHHAVLVPCQFLEKEGFDVTYLPVDSDGLVNPDDVKKAIRKDTILVSIMHANNEVGTIEPVGEIGRITREAGVPFHVDAVQTVGNYPVDVREMGCEMLALSAHKLYGPKGVGAMYLRRGTRIVQLMHGGGQEKGKRAGTHNVPGIVGLGKAAEVAMEEMEPAMERDAKLRDRLIDGISERITGTRLNGHREKRLPNNVNVCVERVEGEAMLLSLDMKGISCSSGSACTTGSLDPSHVLLALGVPVEVTHGSLRFTLGRLTSEDHINHVLDVLPGIVEKLRRMSPV